MKHSRNAEKFERVRQGQIIRKTNIGRDLEQEDRVAVD